MRLTMITINGRTRFIRLPVSTDGKVRLPVTMLRTVFGVQRGDCMIMGR